MAFRYAEDSQDTSNLIVREEAHSTFINQTGDTMLGTLNMNRNRLTGLPTPSDPTDAVNKDFIDAIHRSTASKSYVDRRTRVYGFGLESTITPTEYDVYITITVPTDINANQIMLIVSHPLLSNIYYRGLVEGGTVTPTRTQFRLVFLQPREEMNVTLEGLIYILPSSYLALSGNRIQLTLP